MCSTGKNYNISTILIFIVEQQRNWLVLVSIDFCPLRLPCLQLSFLLSVFSSFPCLSSSYSPSVSKPLHTHVHAVTPSDAHFISHFKCIFCSCLENRFSLVQKEHFCSLPLSSSSLHCLSSLFPPVFRPLLRSELLSLTFFLFFRLVKIQRLFFFLARYEKLAEECMKYIEIVKQAHVRGLPVPHCHYEERTVSVVK